MTRTRLVLMMTVVLLWPSPAHAAMGFWGWLEELSGPGPFRGEAISLTVACVEGKTNQLQRCLPIRKNDRISSIRRTLVVRIGVFDSDAGPRFNDLPETDEDNQGKVRLWAVTGLYLFRLHRSLDIGPGAGFVRLSGARFDPFYKLVLTPLNASFTPFALKEKWKDSPYARLLRLELDNSFVPQGFKGTDFKNSTTKFDSGPEFITRAVVVLDVTAFIW
jgi:hypothetical protein